MLTGESHKKLWEITLVQLKAIVSEKRFSTTREKIESFAAGYGTVLYFEEQDTIKALQEKFPSARELEIDLPNAVRKPPCSRGRKNLCSDFGKGENIELARARCANQALRIVAAVSR